MPWHFPTVDVFRLALTSGAVPAGVSLASVRAVVTGQNYVVEPSVAVPKAAQAELRRLGAQAVKSLGTGPVEDFACWPQLLPLERLDPTAGITPQTPVLLELRDPALLPEVVGEMLRLGNDRQSFRHLGSAKGDLVLLRVIGPPFYTLLRAFDREGAAAPRAYVECAHRVWVEIGHTHPLVQHLKPADGQLLFLRPPRDWQTVAEAPFRDIYDILEFALPSAPVSLRDQEMATRFNVPLRLATASTTEPAELWVLKDRGFEQLDDLVRHSDDQLLARLAFAVTEHNGETIFVLRVRPSRHPPPVLVLLGQGFRPYLRLPNLFLPVGTRLHPPIRREAVRKLLALDPERITWLYANAAGTFTPENLPDAAFRPMADWVSYVLHHEHAALQSWIESATFDFEPFVCKEEERAAANKKQPAEKREPDGADSPLGDASLVARRKVKKRALPADPLPELPRASPSELRKRLGELEQQFLALEGPLDDAARLPLWPELAGVNAALGEGHAADAAICWAHALWPESDAAALAQGWARAEAFDRKVLDQPDPSVAGVRAAAAWLVAQSAVPAEQLARIQRFFQTHEEVLPVRVVWLAAFAAFRLGGDVLHLTRTRDRLLERLFTTGLTHDLDLPSFLRFSGANRSDRLRAFRDWLLQLPDRVAHWITIHPSLDSDPGDTIAYARLMLAFGLARLGEESAARQLAARAKEWLDQREVPEKDVHHFLLEAFDFRIQQALQGKPVSGSLSKEWFELLADKEVGQWSRFKVDRMRTHSRILEPHEEVNAFRRIHARVHDAFHNALLFLPDIIDRAGLEKECRRLLAQAEKASGQRSYQRFKVVEAALKVAPRIGEEFAREMLARVPEVGDGHGDAFERARLLEQALFVAAHFNHADAVQALLARIRQVLRDESGMLTLDGLASLAGHCFRGLRKLGMHDEIRTLLDDLTTVVTRGKPLTGLRKDPRWPAMVRTLLPVAAGWFYFNNDVEGRRLLEEARLLLLHGDLEKVQQTDLACDYVTTLGQAPVELALHAIDELLAKLDRVFDNYTTHTHFSLAKLKVIEAMVLAVVTEDFAMGQVSRRWLEDDEFLIRQRIHRDVRAALAP
jgi:hypothetical protein